MTETVAWGVLGTAKIARTKVIPAMRAGVHSRVAAIASRDLAAAERVAAELGIERTYGSYDALLADPAIVAIYNPLPNHLHVPWTLRALAAGKHVLCEKPVALTAEQAAQLVTARDSSGLLVAEAFMVRDTPWWQRVRALCRDGTLGEVRAIQTFFSYYNTDPANVRNQAGIGGGALMDIGCYAIATARYLLGSEPNQVSSLVDIDRGFGTDRQTSALVGFPGCHLTFTCSTQLAPFQRVIVVGTKARVEVLIPFNAPPDTACRIVIDDGRDLSGGSARVETFSVTDQYTLQGDAFSRAILGQQRIEFPIEDAVANMRVIDAVFAAGATGAVIQL